MSCFKGRCAKGDLNVLSASLSVGAVGVRLKSVLELGLPFLGGPKTKDYCMLGSILGSLY